MWWREEGEIAAGCVVARGGCMGKSSAAARFIRVISVRSAIIVRPKSEVLITHR